jgi:hypothetical protein
MNNITDRFLTALENQLSGIALNNSSLTVQYKASVLICKKAMTKLKSYLNACALKTTEDEIRFYKNIKPQFYSKYIYFINLYNFTVQRPVGHTDIQEAYIRRQLAEIQNFFDHNRLFYSYCRADMTQLDEVYFTRGAFGVHAELEDFEEDALFSTSHDYKLSKIIANERFQDFLHLELAKLGAAPDALLLPFKLMHWTATQTDAVELIYALKASGAVNQGNIDIAELVTAWEYLFQCDLKEVYHKFTDITRRKKIVPVFLTKLADALLRWINDKMGM